MGGFASKVWKKLSGIKDAKIFMLGLDAAGKTTILYKIVLRDKMPAVFNTIPTIGFNVEQVKHQNV